MRVGERYIATKGAKSMLQLDAYHRKSFCHFGDFDSPPPLPPLLPLTACSNFVKQERKKRTKQGEKKNEKIQYKEAQQNRLTLNL